MENKIRSHKNNAAIIGVLLLAGSSATAQPYTFTRPYGAVQTDVNQGYKIIPTQDGNYVIAGNWNNEGYLMKVNCKGDSINRKTYTGVVGGPYKITDVLELANGDLLVGGQCDHCTTGDTTGKVLLFQTDPLLSYKPATGVKKFLPPVSGPLMTTGEAYPNTKLAKTSDGFYALSITRCLSDMNPTFGCWNNEDSYVTKLDNALNIQWHKLLNYKNEFIFHYERDAQIISTPSGLYISRWGNNFFGTVPDSSVVQKTDLNGNPLVSKTFNGKILGTALNPAGTVLTCVGEIGTVAWLMHLNAATLNVLNATLLSETNRTQAATAQYTPDGHLLVGTKHWRTSSVQSRIQRMQSDFTVLQVDTIPNPDNVTNMSVTYIWPTNGDGSRLVSCGIRGFYNRTFFHALSDCPPFNLSLANATPVTCNGFSNGSVTISVSNGYGPFRYRKGNGTFQNSNIFNNLAAGDYVFYARDGNGNLLSLPVTITQPPALSVSASVNLNAITLSASGGTPPYEYRLGLNGAYQTSPVFDTLANGAYLLGVRDANGCSISTTALVNAPPLQAAAAATRQISCAGNTDGQITVTAAGGIPPYWYRLNNGPLQNQSVFSGLGAGSYTVVTTDSQGNTKTSTVTLNGPPLLTLSAVANQSSIVAAASGGTGTLQYSLDGQNFQTGNVFSGLKDGSYTVTVKDANGCTASQAVAVATPPTAAFTANPTSGCGPLTVQFTNAASANATSFVWEFVGGNPTTSTAGNPTVTYSVPGTYAVTLTARNTAGSGTATQTNFITVFPPPEADFIGNANGTTFSFANTSANAMAYLWHFGDGSSSQETNPTHTFAGSPCSERLIVLIATNNCGADTSTLFISHTDPVPPTAAFTFTTLGLTVSFTSIAQFAASYRWDFGDGGSSTEANPMHTYQNPGAYSVKLTVGERCGFLSDDFSQSVILTTPTEAPSSLQHFLLFPNPNEGVFKVETNGAPPAEWIFSLFNATGQRVGLQSFEWQTGTWVQQLDFGGLPPGVYTLYIQAKGAARYRRVVVISSFEF